jgi:PKD repeat protein
MKQLFFIFLFFSQCLIVNAQISKSVTIAAGELSSALTPLEKSSIVNLTVSGSIDARDVKTMRDSMSVLRAIDLSATNVIEYIGPLGTNGTSNITYPSNTIPENAFYTHTLLTSITLPSSLTAIGHKASYSLYWLRTVIIPPSVTIIGDQAFRACDVLASIDLPDELDTIEDWAFVDCKALQAIEIPSKVTSIREMAFKGCYGIKSVHLPLSLTTIEYGVFQGCSALETVNFHSAITSIGPMAFAGTAITAAILPESLKTIGESAFEWCTMLTSVSIPASVTAIGNYAFTYSPGLIEIDADNPNYSSTDGVLFDKLQFTLIHCPVSMTGSYTIPSSVITIDLAAFEQCKYLTAITLPSSLTAIRNFAFKECSKLTTLSIPSTVKSIGSSAFYFCNALTSFYAYPTTPVDLTNQTYVFGNVNTLTCMLYVPYGKLTPYQKANQWKDFTHITEMPGFTLSDVTANVEAVSGSTDSVTINSNTTWTATSDQPWLTVSPETGTTNDTLVFTADANTLTETRTATVTVSATGVASQSVIITQSEGKPGVPVKTILSSVTLKNGMIECYNATDSIIVTGEGKPVLFESGSSATLIAGLSIRFLPGFYAMEGSFMSAYITTNNLFCDGQSGSVIEPPQEKSLAGEEVIHNLTPTVIEQSKIKIYPNPNNGSFIVQSSVEGESRLVVTNLSGQKVYGPVAFNEKLSVQLPNLNRGLYLCWVHNQFGVQTQKIEVN